MYSHSDFFFFFFWLHWVFVAVCRLPLVAVSGGYFSWRCVGFSLRWLLLLWSTGSRHAVFSSCGSRALEHRLSSRSAQAQLLRGMWDLPGPGLKPMSPALAGRFLTTAPSGKPSHSDFDASGCFTQSHQCPHLSTQSSFVLVMQEFFKNMLNYSLWEFIPSC